LCRFSTIDIVARKRGRKPTPTLNGVDAISQKPTLIILAVDVIGASAGSQIAAPSFTPSVE
jgi:hypothetical protein